MRRPFEADNYRYAWNTRNVLGVFEQFIDDVKCSFQRVRYGCCHRDLWNIDAWFLDVMPRMFEEHRDTRHGNPITESTIEDTCTRSNPYEAEYDRIQAGCAKNILKRTGRLLISGLWD